MRLRHLLALSLAVAGFGFAGCQTRVMAGPTSQCCTFDIPTCNPCGPGKLRKLPAHDPVVWFGPSNGGLAARTVGQEFLRDLKIVDMPKGRTLPVSWDSLTRPDKDWQDWLSIGATTAILGHGLYTFAEGTNEEVEDIGAVMKATSACGLGMAAPLVTESLLRHFPNAVEAHVGNGE